MTDADDSRNDPGILTSRDTLSHIVKNNAILREQHDDDIKETTFHIRLDQELIKMRDDTQLMVTDVPGLNEAHTSEKYLDYVKKS